MLWPQNRQITYIQLVPRIPEPLLAKLDHFLGTLAVHPVELDICPQRMAKSKGSVSNLVPLIILFLVLAVLAAVGFVAYSIANDVSSKTRQKMEQRNISFTKEGMKVGVKEVSSEQQQDSTQK